MADESKMEEAGGYIRGPSYSKEGIMLDLVSTQVYCSRSLLILVGQGSAETSRIEQHVPSAGP